MGYHTMVRTMGAVMKSTAYIKDRQLSSVTGGLAGYLDAFKETSGLLEQYSQNIPGTSKRGILLLEAAPNTRLYILEDGNLTEAIAWQGHLSIRSISAEDAALSYGPERCAQAACVVVEKLHEHVKAIRMDIEAFFKRLQEDRDAEP